LVEYHWLDGQFDRVSALVADLVRRRVALIATPGTVAAAFAAKGAASTPALRTLNRKNTF
jgi:putative ABC transport system substrate-binding protein